MERMKPPVLLSVQMLRSFAASSVVVVIDIQNSFPEKEVLNWLQQKKEAEDS